MSAIPSNSDDEGDCACRAGSGAVSSLRRDAYQLTRVAQSVPITAEIDRVLLLLIGTVP